MAKQSYITLTTDKSTLKQTDLEQLTSGELKEFYQSLRFQYDALNGVLFRNTEDQEGKLFLLMDSMQSQLSWNMQHVHYEARSREFSDLRDEGYLSQIIFDYQSMCGISAKEMVQLAAEFAAKRALIAA